MMKRDFNLRLALAMLLTVGAASSCSLNPNVRKQDHFARGQRYMEKGDYPAAVIEYSNAIRIDPNFADAHRELANTYLKMHQPDRAYREFAQVVQLLPADYATRMAMTTLLISNRRFPEAQEQTKVLLSQRPNNPAVHALVSSLLAGEGNTKAAIGEIEKAIALSPSQWPQYLSLALLQWKSSQPVAAEASLKKVIALNPRAAQPRVLLGTFYESQGRSEEAEHLFRDAMAIDTSSMDAREALAKLYIAEGKESDAENILVQANRDLPNVPASFLALSNFYFSTGNLDEAVAVYQALYQTRPKDIQVKKKYIELLIQAKRFDQARQLDNEILNAAPDDSDALLFRSEMQISDGHFAEAIATLQALIKNNPDNGEAHYALGVALKDQGNLNGAEEEWREALRLNPNLLSAERAIADSAMEQGDMRTLQVAATQLIRLQPASPQGYALRALSNINLKQYDQAAAAIQKAIEVAPQSAYGYVQLGNLKLAQNKYDDAVRAYKAALSRNSDSVDAVRGLASAFMAEKETDKAVTAVKSAIAGAPSNSSLYVLLGGILLQDKTNLTAAEANLKKATDLNQHDPLAWILLCEVKSSQGKTDEAIQLGELALRANPGQIGLYLLLGRLSEAKSDWRSAESAYRNAQASNSQNPLISVGLARAMLHTGGNLEVALSLAQKARREMPDSPLAADTVGWVYYQEGLYPLALRSLEDALRLEQSKKVPDNAELHYHLGMTYVRLKQKALARQQLQQVLKLNPGDRNADQIRQELADLKS